MGAGRAARTARLEFQKETGVSLPPLPSEEVEEKPARQLTKAERMEAAAEAALQQQKETEAAEAAELAAAHSARVEKDKQRRREEREAAAAKALDLGVTDRISPAANAAAAAGGGEEPAAGGLRGAAPYGLGDDDRDATW